MLSFQALQQLVITESSTHEKSNKVTFELNSESYIQYMANKVLRMTMLIFGEQSLICRGNLDYLVIREDSINPLLQFD